MIYSNFLLHHGFKKLDTNENINAVCSCFEKSNSKGHIEVHLFTDEIQYEINIRRHDDSGESKFFSGNRKVNPDLFETNLLHAVEV